MDRSRPSGCCRRPERLATRARRGTSGARWRKPKRAGRSNGEPTVHGYRCPARIGSLTGPRKPGGTCVKRDWPELGTANAAARAWCAEVNGQVHSEIAALPAERLLSEREVLRPLPTQRPPLRTAEQRKVEKRGSIRFGSGRYLVPKALVGE